MYKPSAPFNVSMMVLVPTFENINGVPKKYIKIQARLLMVVSERLAVLKKL